MARFRFLDPAMRTSPSFDGASLLARYVMVCLISEADDDGRLLGDIVSLRPVAFPRGYPDGVTDETLLKAIDELARRRLVLRYRDRRQRLIAVTGWKDPCSWQYQHVSKPLPSRLAAPPEGSLVIGRRTPGRRSLDQVQDPRLPSEDGDKPVCDGDKPCVTGPGPGPGPGPSQGPGPAPGPGSRGSAAAPARKRASAEPREGRERLDGSELLEALFALHRDGCPAEHRPALDEAIRKGRTRAPDFALVGNSILGMLEIGKAGVA